MQPCAWHWLIVGRLCHELCRIKCLLRGVPPQARPQQHLLRSPLQAGVCFLFRWAPEPQASSSCAASRPFLGPSFLDVWSWQVGAFGGSAEAHEDLGQPPVRCCGPVGDAHTPYSSLRLCTLDFKKTRAALSNVSGTEDLKFLLEMVLA